MLLSYSAPSSIKRDLTTQISELLSYCFDIANSTALPTTALAIRRLIERYREHRQALHSADASHYEKRAFVNPFIVFAACAL